MRKKFMAVSDLLADTLTPLLDQYDAPFDLSLQVDRVGSLPALDRLRSNEIDIAIIAVPAGKEVRESFVCIPSPMMRVLSRSTPTIR